MKLLKVIYYLQGVDASRGGSSRKPKVVKRQARNAPGGAFVPAQS